MKRIAIFVDGSNFGTAIKNAGFKIDYTKLREFFHQPPKTSLVGSFYFTALPPKDVPSPIRALADGLQYKGWNLVTKEYKTLSSGRIKGNMDIEIVVKAIRLLDNEAITDLILLSGDDDFAPMVEYLAENGIRVTVMSLSTSDTSKNVLGDQLRRHCHEFLNLPDMRQYIEYRGKDNYSMSERRRNFLDGK